LKQTREQKPSKRSEMCRAKKAGDPGCICVRRRLKPKPTKPAPDKAERIAQMYANDMLRTYGMFHLCSDKNYKPAQCDNCVDDVAALKADFLAAIRSVLQEE
jgi:hypothetical protein